MFGASETRFNGRATFSGSPSNVAGVYGAAGAGAAVGVGAQAIVLRNEKGATLELTGRQVGLQVNADLSGLASRCGSLKARQRQGDWRAGSRQTRARPSCVCGMAPGDGTSALLAG